MIQLKMHR